MCFIGEVVSYPYRESRSGYETGKYSHSMDSSYNRNTGMVPKASVLDKTDIGKVQYN